MSKALYDSDLVKSKEGILEHIGISLLVNLSTILLAIIAGFIVWRSGHIGKVLFSVGLLIIVATGLIAVPATYYLASTSEFELIVFSNIFGILQGVGLIVCAIAMTKVEHRR